MATKSANLYARIEPEVKEQAESILSALGIPASNAINMFYKQIILNRGLPFEVKLPTAKPVNVAEMTKAELNAELRKDMRIWLQAEQNLQGRYLLIFAKITVYDL